MIPLDYRLTLKYPLLAALDDCYFALLWAASHSAQLWIDPVLQMLVYPMLDDWIMHENPSFQKESKYHLYARHCARDREPQ